MKEGEASLSKLVKDFEYLQKASRAFNRKSLSVEGGSSRGDGGTGILCMRGCSSMYKDRILAKSIAKVSVKPLWSFFAASLEPLWSFFGASFGASFGAAFARRVRWSLFGAPGAVGALARLQTCTKRLLKVL